MVTFNVGVEIAQLLFVGNVLLVLAVLRPYLVRVPAWLPGRSSWKFLRSRSSMMAQRRSDLETQAFQMTVEDKAEAEHASLGKATTHASGLGSGAGTRSANAGRSAAPSAGIVAMLRREPFLLVLVAVLLLLTVVDPTRVARYPRLVDWPTVTALAGLMVLTKGIELSGYLHGVAIHLIARLRTTRSLALFLVISAALLATVLTNDIALFIVVPLTLALRRLADLPIARLIVFEALAVNAGSALTPIGNPQNLFLWHVSQTSFVHFTAQMLPLVALLILSLLLLTVLCFDTSRIEVGPMAETPSSKRRLFAVSLLLYVPFVVLIDMHRPMIGLAAVLVIYLVGFRRILMQSDWALIVVFILMFIDLRLVAEIGTVRDALRHVGLDDPRHLFVAGIFSSQIISNVPAVILLEPYSRQWALLAYAVNVGGFGFVLGSLANLIALRLAQTRGIWLTFHLYSIPFLMSVGLLVYAWLFWI